MAAFSASDISNVLVKSIFVVNPHCLNVIHFNVASIFPKIDEIRHIFQNSNTHIIAISETWLKSNISSKAVELPGFRLFRSDRKRKRGGGVAIYVSLKLNARVVASSASFSPEQFKTNYLFIEVVFPSTSVLFGVIYKPPATNDLVPISNMLHDIVPEYDDVIIMGDFNENVLKIPQHAQTIRLIQEFKQISLNLLSSQPTHFFSTGSSLLDLAFTKNVNNMVTFTQLDTSLSKHDILVARFLCSSPVTAIAPIYRRKLNLMNTENVLNDAISLPWHNIYNLTDINEMTSSFEKNAITLLDAHAPLELIRAPKQNCQPWFDSAVQCVLFERNIAKRVWKANRTPENHEEFKRLRNKAVLTVRNAKIKFYAPRLNSTLKPSVLWRNLKNLGCSTESNELPPFSNEVYNAYLMSSIPIPIHPTHTFVTPVSSHITEFSFRPITLLDLIGTIVSIKSNSTGLDNIPIKLIRLILPVAAPYLLHIINFSLTSSIFPSSWKRARVIPLHKNTRSYEPKDFRPVSILPVLSKVLEIAMKNQVNIHLANNNLLNDFQSGFRHKHSTTSALLNVTDNISRFLDKKELSVLILLDFSKAFDTVSHKILCKKLSLLFGFCSSAVKLISNYLSNRSQCVDISGNLSTVLPINSGVPQGSVLGPVLFSMFINDLPLIIQNTNKYHLFADDVQLIYTCPPELLSFHINLINSDLKAVTHWCKSNHLILNFDKTKCLLFTPPRSNFSTQLLPPIMLDNKVLAFSKSAKNLGLIMSDKLNWTEHATAISSKVFAGLRSLWIHGNLIPIHTRMKLVKALLIPKFSYCDVVLSAMPANVYAILERALNACTRFVFRIRKYDNLGSFRNKILGCSLKTFLKFHTCLFIKKTILTSCPTYIRDKLVFGQSVRNNHLKIPSHSTKTFQCSFFVMGPIFWNSIPRSIRDINSIVTFKKSCFNYLAD